MYDPNVILDVKNNVKVLEILNHTKKLPQLKIEIAFYKESFKIIA